MNIGPAAFVGAAAGMAHAAMRELATANAGQFVVNHDNVLAAAKIIQNQVEVLSDRVAGSSQNLRVEAPGEDMVSGMVAKEWNERLIFEDGSYVARVTDYVDSLKNLVVQLKDSALAYGYNEDEVAAALGKPGA